MAYHHRVSTHHRSKRARKIKRFTVGFTLLIIIGSAVIGVDWLLSQINNSSGITTTQQHSTVQSANVTVYRTKYFQFQAPDDWISIADSSNDNKFVYVRNDGSIVSRRFSVYINKAALNIESVLDMTRVIPVNYNSNGTFSEIGSVSDHCNDSWPSELPRNPSRIIHDNVSLVCSPSSAQYNVVIGERDGDEKIEATLEDGEKFTLTLVYSDLSAYPTPGDVRSILSSFRTL